MKVALVYDRVNKWGGAERLLLALHSMFPRAPLYTAVYSPKKATWAKVFPKVHTSFLQKIPILKTRHEMLGTFMPLAFESFDFSKHDLVISVTSEAAKVVITTPNTKHISICLTPTRYLWSGHDVYFKNPVLRFFSRPAVSYLRHWDKIAAYRPDELVAISTTVQKRIRKYYKRKSVVIHPPTNLTKTKRKMGARGDYYLLVSRLVPYKKVDLVIKTFNKLGLPLVIVGEGNQKMRLMLMAKRNIKFTGKVTDEELTKHYQTAKVLIMPQEEDFGLTAIEAQTLGTPVIAFSKGGALDSVIDKKTGILFNRQSVKSLTKAIGVFEKTKFDEETIRKNVDKFSTSEFIKKLRTLINGTTD